MFMIGIGLYTLVVVLLGAHGPKTMRMHPTTTTSVYGTISIIGAGKNDLGNAPYVVFI